MAVSDIRRATDLFAVPLASASPARWGSYRNLLAKILLNKRKGILAEEEEEYKGREHFPDQVLDGPELMDDVGVNLLDWGYGGRLAVSLGGAVHLWCPTRSSPTTTLSTGDVVRVTSVSWAPDGCHIAVGLNNSHIQFWDSTCNRLLRTITHGHGRRSRSRVGAVSWNGNVLTSGGADGLVIDNDPRLRTPHVQTSVYKGHRKGHEVCGLNWSGSAHQLASGGSDGLVNIWDSRIGTRSIFCFNSDPDPGIARAVAWCPFRDHLLATGGGKSINFWNTLTGKCINSVNTIAAAGSHGSRGSQVLALMWSKSNQELLSSCGNQLTLWEYPSVRKIGQLNGHTDRVLYLAQSPDGCTIASASGGDETIRLWKNVFPPMPPEDSPKGGAFTTSHRAHIR